MEYGGYPVHKMSGGSGITKVRSAKNVNGSVVTLASKSIVKDKIARNIKAT